MKDDTAKWRQERLGKLANALGGNAALGRKLGYKDGAFVGQMLKGLRPITEKTVEAAEAIRDVRLGAAGAKGWFARGPAAPAVTESAAPYAVDAEHPAPHSAVEDAVRMLAEVLQSLDEGGRELAGAVLARMAKNPHDEIERSIRVLTAAVGAPPEPPEAPAPAPGKKTTKAKSASAQRARSHSTLVLKLGGGHGKQLSLPIRSLRNVLKDTDAPPSEREWYGRLKAPPKVKGKS